MKTRLLLLIFVLLGTYLGVSAQDDTIKSLVISEIRINNSRSAYAEFTNMGADSVDIQQFSFYAVAAWNKVWKPSFGWEWRFPGGGMLAPGESWTIAQLWDWRQEWAKKRPDIFLPVHKEELEAIADEGIHRVESGLYNGFPGDGDSIYPYGGSECFWSWGQASAFILKWISEDGTDSALVDQVNLVPNGPLDDIDNTAPITGHRQVAGVDNATETHHLIRKFSVKEGNLDWENAAGNDLAESEWMPVPNLSPFIEDFDRGLFWTVGNHDDYNLDENTLTSHNPDVVVDYAAGTISVPWGFRNNDSVMYQMDRKPGVAWHYTFSPEREDSAFVAARNGDILTVYVCGNDMDVKDFTMVVRDPEPGANIVVPKNSMNWTTMLYNVHRGNPYEVTEGLAMDTIYDIPYGTRMDSLLLYLEKPPAATWEFVTLNNEVRADVKDGDLLRVTAENSDVKDYYIKTDIYRASRNPNLASIRWPDIDEFTYNAFGWKGDTIPNFSTGNTSYTLKVPYYVTGTPHLLAKPVNVNTRIEVTRPKTLLGSLEERTMTFHCVAEDDSSEITYFVVFEKEKDPIAVQPWSAQPFISQYCNEAQYENWDNAIEYMNPGTEQINMSHYMIASAAPGTSPADVVTSFTDWADRFRKYIPGMSFVDSSDWVVTPGLFKEDLTVNPITYGGDVFVVASAGNRVPHADDGLYHWNQAQFDVNFRDTTWHPWTDWAFSNFENPRNGSAIDLWNGNYYLFRIDNDSVYNGDKPATDPQDFTLIDIFGFMDGSDKYDYMNRDMQTGIDEPKVKGHKATHFRKMHVFKGKPEGFSEAAKVTNDSSEFYALFSDKHLLEPPYSNFLSWGDAQRWVLGWLGSHEMDEVTAFMSFVISTTYLVDDGYQGDNLRIRGVVTGTTVTDFEAGIIKKDEGQTLTVKDAGGTVITGSTPVPEGATLTVLSADKEHETTYHLMVTAGGLSSDAVLTSDVYEITIAGSVGFVTDIPYGETLTGVVANVVVPAGAEWIIVDDKDFFVPFKVLNFDTVQVDVHVSDKIYLEVTAEDLKTMIKYQLLPVSEEGDLFVTSDFYEVDQGLSVISLVPGGTNAMTLLNSLTPSAGATIRLLDKYGFERTFGNIYMDDRVEVTALDGVTKRYYNLVILGLDELANYLAYVTSEVYEVSQIAMSISGVAANTDVTTLTGNLVAAPMSTLEVLDEQGVAKQSSDIVVSGDQVKVTAENGVTVAYYSISSITGMDPLQAEELRVYPNPTSGMFHLEGLSAGDHIRVYSARGAVVLERIAVSSSEMFSVEGEPAGMYFITVEGNGSLVRKLKLIKSE